MVNDELPGITLHLDVAQMLPPSTHKPMEARARLTLTAEIQDMEVWEEVVKRFDNEGDGMRIHTVTSFAEEMVDVVRTRRAQDQQEYEFKLLEKNERITQLEQQVSFAKADAERLGTTVDFLKKELDGRIAL